MDFLSTFYSSIPFETRKNFIHSFLKTLFPFFLKRTCPDYEKSCEYVNSQGLSKHVQKKVLTVFPLNKVAFPQPSRYMWILLGWFTAAKKFVKLQHPKGQSRKDVPGQGEGGVK